MSLGHGPSIVRNGLVLHLDAANAKSYPGTGTTWTDLSGNGNHFTLVNGVGYSADNNGTMIFDGGNDYASTAYQQPAQDATTSFTWTAWVYPLVIDLTPLIGNRNNILVFTKITATRFEYYPTNIGGPMTPNAWQSVTIVKNNTNFSYYINGILNATGVSSGVKSAIPFFVGADPFASEYSRSRISTVQVYHRALTLTEIAQNFNATRSRYGI
jgi:hypothetical protein